MSEDVVVKISTELLDRLAGFLVMMRREDPAVILLNLPKIREVAESLQTSIQAIRGAWGECRVCNPPLRLRIEEMDQHDITTHGVKKTPCLLQHPDNPAMMCRHPRGHFGAHQEKYTTW